MEFKKFAHDAGETALNIASYSVPLLGMDARRYDSEKRTRRENPDAPPGSIKMNAGDWAIVVYNAAWATAAFSPILWYFYNHSF